MKKIKVIGTGAAGNKGVIDLIKAQLIGNDECILVNSTDRDVPEDFKEFLINIGDGRGGCGKEFSLGRELAEESLHSGDLGQALELLIDDNDESIIIVTSAEGGTGNGSTRALAEYCDQELELNTHIVIFTGFEDDARGLANTVELFKSINKNAIVHIIRNSTFLNDAKGSYVLAEQLANQEFCRLYESICGLKISPSFQNMDETDLYKTVNYPGYCVSMSINLGKTNVTQESIDEAIKTALSDLKTYRNDNGKCRMLGVILSIYDPTIPVNRRFEVIRDFFGNAHDGFVHLQYCNEDEEQNVTFIVSGMDMPQKDIQSIYDRYKKESSTIKRGADNFFEKKDTLKTDSDEFDFMVSRRNRRGSKKKEVEIPQKDSKLMSIPKEVFEKQM